MDVINPELIWIDGICYRINDCHEVPRHEECNIPMNHGETFSEDDIEDEFTLISCSNGRLKTSLHIPQSFFGYIIGAKGTTRKRIENETKTDIKIPGRGQSGDVIVTGNDAKGVTTAARRIQMIVSAARMKQRPTHFLSIPVNSDIIKQNFEKFKEDVLEENPGIEASIFIEPEKIHMTLITMHLADNEEREIAKNYLEDAKNKIITPLLDGVKLNFKVKGISYMNDDPKAVHVLYTEVVEREESNIGILTQLANELKFFFAGSGLLVGNYENIKLHITLMNTQKTLNNDDYNEKKKAFDASKILEKYSQHEFGDVDVKNIHLSQMGSKGQDGYYQSTAVVSV